MQGEGERQLKVVGTPKRREYVGFVAAMIGIAQLLEDGSKMLKMPPFMVSFLPWMYPGLPERTVFVVEMEIDTATAYWPLRVADATVEGVTVTL